MCTSYSSYNADNEELCEGIATVVDVAKERGINLPASELVAAFKSMFPEMTWEFERYYTSGRPDMRAPAVENLVWSILGVREKVHAMLPMLKLVPRQCNGPALKKDLERLFRPCIELGVELTQELKVLQDRSRSLDQETRAFWGVDFLLSSIMHGDVELCACIDAASRAVDGLKSPGEGGSGDERDEAVDEGGRGGDGYQTGMDEGGEDFGRNPEFRPRENDGYLGRQDDGHDTGELHGYRATNNDGPADYHAGRTQGYHVGWSEGYAAGERDWYQAGRGHGYLDGRRDGFEAGRIDGLRAGGNNRF